MKARRIMTVVGGALAAVVLSSGAASAFDCYNASIPAPDWEVGDAPLFRGTYVWLPSIGVPSEAWGFPVPDNFQGGDGFHLLQGSDACGNENRQTEHGIQAGECLGGEH